MDQVSPGGIMLQSPGFEEPILGSADQQAKTSFVDSDFSGVYVIASSASSQSTGSNALIEINASAGFATNTITKKAADPFLFQ